MKKGLFCILVACGIGLPAFDLGKIGFYLTNESLYQYNRVASGKNQFYEQLSLFANYSTWSAGLTLRVHNFYKQDTSRTFPSGRVDLYKMFLQYQGKRLSIQVGDFHAMLGRGLTLSVLPNDKLLRDRTITGGDLRLNQGALQARFLGGIVRDETRSQEWMIIGTEGLYEYRSGHRLGLHASMIGDRMENTQLGDRLAGSVSASGSFLRGDLIYYTEAGLLFFADERPLGNAVFGNLTYRKGAWTFMAEARRYKDFWNELNNPPGADREDELCLTSDASSTRLYLQYTLADPDLYVFLNAGSIREYGEDGTHFYGGMAAQDLFDRLNLSFSAGVRRIVYPVLKIDADALYRLHGSLSVELTYKEKSYSGSGIRFCERDLIAQVSLAPRGSAYLQYQYSAALVLDRHHFLSGGIRVYFSSGAYVEAVAGAIRGGEVCAEGQCFNQPPFEGFKLAFFAVLK